MADEVKIIIKPVDENNPGFELVEKIRRDAHAIIERQKQNRDNKRS